MTQGGFGAVLKIADNSGTLIAVTKVIDFEFPEFEKILADVTSHDSPSGYAEHIATGKRMLNEFTVTLLWDRDQDTHHKMVAAFDSDLPVNMSTEDPDGVEVIAFSAHVRTISRIAEQEEGYRAEVGIQPTGIPSITYTSA